MATLINLNNILKTTIGLAITKNFEKEDDQQVIYFRNVCGHMSC